MAGVLCPLLVLIASGAGCSAATSDRPGAAAERVEAAGEGAGHRGAPPEEGEKAPLGDRCQGVVGCTFFGLGTAIAVPFWLLGAVLGLLF